MKIFLSMISIAFIVASCDTSSELNSQNQKLEDFLTEVEEENKAKVQEKRNIVSDSLQSYEFKILNLRNNSETAGELGPLKYIGVLTGISMDRIINILLLLIIFVSYKDGPKIPAFVIFAKNVKYSCSIDFSSRITSGLAIKIYGVDELETPRLLPLP